MSNAQKIISAFLSLVIVICLVILGYMLYSDKQDTDRQQELVASVSPEPVPESTTVPDTSEEAVTSTEETPSSAEPDIPPSEEDEILPVENPYRDAYLANPDMHAWLQIPGTVIDYPVMWTPEDENKYLYLDFEGRENKNGSLLLDTDSCLSPLTTNLIIHGHNMKSGAMFGNLTDYEKPDYYQKHKNIILYTPECQRNYEVIAVFRSQVYKKSDEVFKFYKFFQADSQEEFDDFYNNIKNLSLYDTGVTASYGDRFLTLSTCVYHVKNGRFVVVAKEVEPGDSYLPVRNSEP